MAGPWEQFQTRATDAPPPGPWTKFQPQAQAEELPPEPADTGDQSYLGALGSAAAGSLVSGMGKAVQGAGEAPAGAGRAATNTAVGIMDRIDRGETVPDQEDVLGYQYASPEQRQTLRSQAAGWQAQIGAKPASNVLTETGKNIVANAATDFPVSPAQEGVGTGVARMIGGVGAAVPAMILGGAAGGPGGAALGAAAVIWPQTYSSTLEEARAKGASEDEAHKVALTNAAVQAGAMSVPVGRVFARIPAAFREPLAQTMVNLSKGGIEFGSLTALSKFADNFVAKQTFDPERPLTQGVADATLEGTIAGAMIPLGGVGARAVTGAARRATAPMADRTTVELAQAQQALADIAQGKQPAPNVPPSVESAPSGEPPPGGDRPLIGEGGSGRSLLASPPVTPAMRAAIETLDNIATGVKPGEQAPVPGMSPELSGALRAAQEMAAEQRAPAHEPPPSPPVAEAPAGVSEPTGGDRPLVGEGGRGRPLIAPPVEQAAPPVEPPSIPPEPPAPTRIRTLSEIQQVDGVGPREAQRIQTAEIEAIGRPISAEDMAARKAGVSVAPPRRAEVPPQGVPFMITQAMRADLRARGLSDQQISGMTPAQAHEFLAAPSVPEPPPSVESPPAEPFKAFTPSGTEITLRPELVDLSQLVPSNAPDGRVNPAYPGELQPRDRSQPASQAQVQEIAGNLRPELLAPGPDVTTGAPIIGPDGAVESGNGRIMALTRVLTDPALAPKRAAYMAWLESQGYDASGMQNPVLVSRRVSELTPEQRPVFAIEANDRTNMAMSPAEAARADATRAAQAMNLWEGTSATSASNRGFVRAFMGALPATERGRMIDSHGNLSPEGADRISRAVMAHAYGDEAGGILNRFLNSENEGMKAVAGAMQDMAGGWAQLRAAAERGDIPRSLDITRPLIEAVQTLAEARRLDRPVKEVLSQVDFEKPPVSAEAVGILRNFFRDEGMRQPAGRKAVGDFLAEYATRAQKQRPAILEGHTISDPTEIMRGQRGEAPKGQDSMFAAREAKAAGEHAEARSKGQPEAVKEVREALYRVMQAFMRHVGLPPRVGLKFVDQLLSPAADASYHRGLIEFALDTKPGEVPLKLFHEVTHALLDPKLGLLTPAETKALNLAADRWLKKPENRAALEKVYPKADAAVLREEAVARLAEEALSYGMREPPAVTRAARNMRNFVVGVGQALRGQGFRTSDDVFRALMHGEMRGREGIGEGSDVQRNAIRAYHGSPHDFDRFDLSKIGTGVGDGNPVGHGLYFAGSEHLADWYAGKKVGSDVALYKGSTPFHEVPGAHYGWGEVDARVKDAGGWDNFLRTITDENGQIAKGWRDLIAEMRDAGLEYRPKPEASRRMYEVKLNVPPDSMLSRDFPLANQSPAVREALKGIEPASTRGPLYGRDFAPRTAEAAAALKDRGIPGMTYLGADGPPQLQRGMPNYVMFDPSKIEIERKYAVREPERKAVAAVRGAMGRLTDASKGFADVIRSSFAPITTGHTTARAEAARFANAEAKVGHWAMKIDRALRKDFNPEQRRRMFDAMDDQSLFEIELREAMRDKPPEEAAAIEKAAREAFVGHGIDALPENLRRVVVELDQVSRAVWENQRSRGLVGEHAQGLPYYTPRFFVQALGEGRAAALPSRGEGASHAIDPLGLNLTTAGPMRRTIRITEDSLRALRAKYADADLVRDIRVLPMALARGMRSVAGVDLVNAIRDHGKAVGFDPITTDVPPGMASSYRTIDHPALMEWKPALVKGPDGNWVAAKGPDGKPAMVRTPMKVHVDFEGPLRAVLTRPGNKLYRGLLEAKNAAVGMIMYSPMIHNAVEWSRAFPLMGLPMLWGKPYFEGHRLGRDFAYMNDAIDHGLRPVGGSWKADATGIYEQAHGKAGNSYTAKALGAAGDVVNKELGDKMRRAVDTVGEFWHQKLLWDQVRALQVGIYDGMLKRYTEAGAQPDVARYMAAHLANRYAGALPREAMSNAANMAANLGLFSRSFTLGNLGAMKDMFNGMPAYVRAQIEQAAGPEAVKTAKGQLRKKAIAAFVVDLGLTYIGNALLQNAIKMALGDEDLDDVAKGYFRRLTRLATGDWESLNPLENLTPNSENEPGKKGRIYAGRDSTGTAGYFRNPLGKIGEDFAGWITDPLNTAVRKMAPMPKAIMEVLTNTDSMGRPVRNKEAHGIAGSIDNAGDVVKHIAKSFFPVDALHATWGALRDGALVAQGKPAQDPHPVMNAAKAVGPLLGVQTSRGYPGGPQEGEMAGILRNRQFVRSRAIPEARAKFQRGDEDGARKVLTDAGLSNPEIATAMRGIRTPDRSAVSRQRAVAKIASPEQREAIERLRPRP